MGEVELPLLDAGAKISEGINAMRRTSRSGLVTVIGGNAIVDGQVDGDVTTYGGTIQMGPNASISGSN